MSFDFVDYKKDFPLLMQQDIAYLDSAATAQRPASVLQAEKEFYEQANANPLRGLYELGVEATDRYEAARERVRKFLNARSDAEIIFTRNTTESINLVAYSYALNNIHAGDEIEATVVKTDDGQGNILLSRKEANDVLAWEKLQQMMEDGTVVKVRIKESVPSCLLYTSDAADEL